MTIEEMKSLQVGSICKDIEISNSYGIDVFCKIIRVENDRIEIDCIENNFCEAYPITLFYRTCSWKIEHL